MSATRLFTLVCLFTLVAPMVACQSRSPRTERWSIEQAQQWYAQYPWLVGCNYNPATAGNQLEMWREEDFAPEVIAKEFAYAQEIGFNLMRVYLHDLLYENDKEGLYERMDQFLEIADRHGITVMFVLLDDVWRPNFEYDEQFEPVPGRHNSIWVQSPGAYLMQTYPENEQLQQRLENYVKDTLRRFADDDRIFCWDLFNEPGNTGRHADGSGAPTTYEQSFALTRDVFKWAREVNPSQPLTVGQWARYPVDHPLSQYEFNQSDIISFHDYDGPDQLREHVEQVVELAAGRPMVCTEYMARTNNSTFEGALPIFAEHNIAAINWGFVAGRSNTIYPWNSWQEPGKLPEPDVWFHDVIRPDGSPYSQTELDFIKRIIRETRG